jgi:hypothetical protein
MPEKNEFSPWINEVVELADKHMFPNGGDKNDPNSRHPDRAYAGFIADRVTGEQTTIVYGPRGIMLEMISEYIMSDPKISEAFAAICMMRIERENLIKKLSAKMVHSGGGVTVAVIDPKDEK